MAATSPHLPVTTVDAELIRRVERRILLIRGEKVMLDRHLAELYGVGTKSLNQAVKRNPDRFPEDFMFQLTLDEVRSLRYQFGTSKDGAAVRSQTVTSGLRSQSVTSNERRGGRRYLPYAFTEQGVAMLSSVLGSQQAVQVNIAIMRAFVRLRELLATHKELARKLEELERKYDKRFRVVFVAIRQLMAASDPRQRIGF